MTKPRSLPALRSDKVQIFRDEGENVRSTNAADSADYRKLLDQNQDHLDVSKDDECDRKKMNCKTPKSQ